MLATLVRTAVDGDLESVFQIEKTEMAPDYYPRFFFKQALSIFGKGFAVASTQQKLMGYILAGDIFDEPTVSEVYSIVVSSEFRGRGVGRSLMLHVIAELRDRGFKTLRLSVAPKNKVACQLYRSLGFNECGLERDYFGRNEDRHIMEKVFQD